MPNAVIDGYEAAAAELIPRFESIPTDVLLEPVSHLLPSAPCRVLDVGAGAGRNPAWFAAHGHEVTAIEPVAAFRDAAATCYPDAGIRWVDDVLPHLQATKSHGETYDFVLLSAVWQHVEPSDHAVAMASLASLMRPDALLVISVRHGAGAPDRPVYASSDGQTQALAHRNGLRLRFYRQTDSIQAANRATGVTWSWMVFKADWQASMRAIQRFQYLTLVALMRRLWHCGATNAGEGLAGSGCGPGLPIRASPVTIQTNR